MDFSKFIGHGFLVEYNSSKQSIVVDALSRKLSEEDVKELRAITFLVIAWVEQCNESHLNDPKIQYIFFRK